MGSKRLIWTLAFIAFATFTAVAQQRESLSVQFPDPIKSVQIYPNPAVDVVSIKFETPLAKKVKYSVHNILGNSLNLESEIVDEYEIRIRVKDLSEGYYFVSLRDENSNQRGTYKFLKR